MLAVILGFSGFVDDIKTVAVALVMMFSFGMVRGYNGIISDEVFAEDWEYLDDNLYLYGTGSMWDFSYSASFAAEINAFDINKIIINEGITY